MPYRHSAALGAGLFSCLAAGLFALIAAPSGALAQDQAPAGKLAVELNKLEPQEGGGCRAYFLFRNDTGASFEAFQMSLAIFDSAGVIDRLLAIDAAPLPVARTTLKLFDIPGLGCEAISSVLLHDMPACKPQNADPVDCYGLVTLSSKTQAALVQ